MSKIIKKVTNVRGVLYQFLSFLKCNVILLLIVTCGYVFFVHSNAQTKWSHVSKDAAFKLGLENLNNDFLQKIASRTIGLITNQTGKTQDGRRNIDYLLKRGFKIKKIFTPEHGLSGMTHTDAKITTYKDKKTGVAIVPLYSQGQPKKIDAQMVKDIDILMFDIQDAGMRHYTYITTLYNAMESAAIFKKAFVVLDRPNLLGICMNGPLVQDGFYSGISVVSVPLRHGMTFGELALYINIHRFKKQIQLSVIPMKNYKRSNSLHNKLITYLSPNIQNLNSCYCYSFLGILGELRPLNIGLGTKRKFECLLLDDKINFSQKKWMNLQRIMKSHGVESSLYGHEYKKNNYKGLQLKVKDVNKLLSFNLLVKIIEFFKKSGVNISFSRMFNLAVGTDKLELFFAEKYKKDALEKYINNDLMKFYRKAKSCFLYKPIPLIVPFKV